MSMQPSIYAWYERHPELLDDVPDDEIAYLLGVGEDDEEGKRERGLPEFDPSQPRDDQGRWSDQGGGQGDEPSGGGDKGSYSDTDTTPHAGLRKRIEQHVRPGGKITLDGLSHKMQSILADTLDEVYTEHPSLRPLRSIVPLGRPGVQAGMGQNGTLLFNPKTVGTLKMFTEDYERGEKARVYWRDRIDKLPPGGDRAMLIAELRHLLRSPAGYKADPTFAGVVRHELGHWARQQIKRTPEYAAAMGRWVDRAKAVSGYAMEHPTEYVAESFSIYRGKRASVVDPDLAVAFRTLTKKKGLGFPP